MNLKRLSFQLTFLCLPLFPAFSQQISVDQKVADLLSRMTLEEKIGQMNQYNDDWIATGPVTLDADKAGQIRNGQVGSLLNCVGTARTRKWQEEALKSRLKIPLLFGQDVIHGYKTTFPIPLAESCTWDPELLKKSARVAAVEASSAGIHWTFAPMVDIARDPRWGRVMEGSGEDPYLGSLIAAARVTGFQGTPGSTDGIMACAKHFAAYGAAVGGRDYNTVDMSDYLLWNVYLPPFLAAKNAGVATFMNSFNDLNGVPATGNAYLQRDILKGRWKFDGFVVSDWGSIGEMINHGSVKDGYEAALSAVTAGSDMDMESRSYKNHLATLVREGKVPVALIDEAAGRILKKKFELGLFDDPFRFCDPEREKKALSNPDHARLAREVAAKSIVLLKNDGEILPVRESVRKIAFIGPLVKAVKQNKGFWDVEVPGVDSSFIVSQWQGLVNRVGEDRLLYAEGCKIEGTDKSGFAEARRVAEAADVVVVSIGERRDLSGEAKSRASITLPGVQTDLVLDLLKTGKPVIVLINAGRPLVFPELSAKAPAILYTWWLGSEAGNAIADVLFGTVNPSARLTLSFPVSVGQIPIYYNYYNTGRPATTDSNRFYNSSYLDESIWPKYEFGYGLSYTTFAYSDLKLDRKELGAGGKITVTLNVTNTGRRTGTETVQLYLRDKVASMVRPVKELKDFARVTLAPGETRPVTFIITDDKLAFYNARLEFAAEPGEFDLMIGASSRDIRLSDSFTRN